VPAGSPSAATAPSGVERYIVIAGTGGAGAYLRRTPRRDDRLNAWPEGTRLAIVGPDAEAEGLRWHQVRDPNGQIAWIPADYARTIDPATGVAQAVFVSIVTPQSSGIYLRRTPRMDDRLNAWPDGTRLEVIGPDVEGDGRRWKHVRGPDGQQGYVPVDYVQIA
jgi:SH3-like domain-containing protein